MVDEGWDLNAVVRSCRPSSSGAAGPSATRDPFSSFPLLTPPLLKLDGEELEAVGGGAKDGTLPLRFPDLFENYDGGLQEFLKPFHRKVQQQEPDATIGSTSSSASHVARALAGGPWQQPTPQPQLVAVARQGHRPPSQVPRSKRRKNQQKKVVCHVPADGLSSDMWAWRKYGQKPIKGSPYPRGYYRCSSSKGCLARKQVERSRTDPAMFIITYTAEHNHPVPIHRNSLAGSTRTKLAPHSSSSSASAAPAGDGDGGAAIGSPPSSSAAAELSPTTPLTSSMEDEEDEEEDEGMLLVEDMEVIGEEDFLFLGGPADTGVGGGGVAAEMETKMAELFEGDSSGCDGDQFFSLPPLPWLSSSNSGSGAAAAAAAGGSR